MSHAIGGHGPSFDIPGNCHDVNKDAQRCGQADPTAEQDTEIAAEKACPIEAKNASDAWNTSRGAHDRRPCAGLKQSEPDHHNQAATCSEQRSRVAAHELRNAKEKGDCRAGFVAKIL